MHPRFALTRTLAAVLVSLALTACTPANQPSANSAPADVADLARVAPEAVGLSSERLERLSAAMQGLVDEGRLAGITTLIARHGKVAHFGTFGAQDMEAAKPMAEDAIFRIYSMTKPITSVALMLLYEEGRFRLSDPVEKFIPEFKDLPVAVGEDENGIITEPADHPMTIRELMSHTAGLSYGIFSESPVDKLYRDAEILHPDSTLRDMIEDLAAIPLRQQPGTIWHYSVAVDVQGYLVEVLSGQPFDEFLKERIFDPLGMADTSFWVPPEKADRLAQVYVYGEDGALQLPSDEPLRPARLSFSGELPLRGRRAGLHHHGLRPLLPDAAQRWRAGWRAPAGPLDGGTDVPGPDAQGRSRVLPRPRLRPQLRRHQGPGGSRQHLQRRVLLGRRRRHLVLDRPSGGPHLRRHDPAIRRKPARRALVVAAADLSGSRGGLTIESCTPSQDGPCNLWRGWLLPRKGNNVVGCATGLGAEPCTGSLPNPCGALGADFHFVLRIGLKPMELAV